ncbi:hypothetical protein TEA_004952 [Camellia sinensis var. sinensis]|uniref:Protein kinase domain-containing protein n=1 Tax=Camellia sinensis var. sinensis TaxID=542762 RepID=A0A4S4EMV2_CAMSN|nr:hypothetical protein TEA_004952 [Camellia sinensis var. sinensis]
MEIVGVGEEDRIRCLIGGKEKMRSNIEMGMWKLGVVSRMVVFFLSVKCELKGTFCIASWRGIKVAVKRLKEEVTANGDKVRAFRDELALLQKIRHPNVVQFLGAVTQSTPMMILTEYLPKGDLRAFLKRKGALKPTTAVRFALDIARNPQYAVAVAVAWKLQCIVECICSI